MNLNICSCVDAPGDLRAPLGLLRDLRQLPVALVAEEAGGVRRLEPVQSALRQRPLRLPLAPPVVLLVGEGRLEKKNHRLIELSIFLVVREKEEEGNVK